MLHLGQAIVDMHGGNFKTLDRKSVLLQHYEFRGGVEWIDEDNGGVGTYLQQVCKRSGKVYTNKYLVIVSELLNDPEWCVAMYSYDARRVGVIQIRERA